MGSDADSSDNSDCRNKRSAMSKLFGEWPIDMFEDMPEEQQKAFWKGPFWKAVASQAMMHGESIGVDAANSWEDPSRAASHAEPSERLPPQELLQRQALMHGESIAATCRPRGW